MTLAYIPVDVTMIHLIHLEQLCIHMCIKLSKYTLHVNRVNIMSVLKVLFFGLKVWYNLLIIFDYVNLVKGQELDKVSGFNVLSTPGKFST